MTTNPSELYCPVCGGDDIRFEPPIAPDAKRSDITCICDKCGRRFPPPYAWWQINIAQPDRIFTEDELQALREWLDDDTTKGGA